MFAPDYEISETVIEQDTNLGTIVQKRIPHILEYMIEILYTIYYRINYRQQQFIYLIILLSSTLIILPKTLFCFVLTMV